MDVVGLDVVLDIENHYAETREALPEGPRNLLKGMIAERKLAVKSNIKMIIVRDRMYAMFTMTEIRYLRGPNQTMQNTPNLKIQQDQLANWGMLSTYTHPIG
jgi:hypothetical protein